LKEKVLFNSMRVTLLPLCAILLVWARVAESEEALHELRIITATNSVEDYDISAEVSLEGPVESLRRGLNGKPTYPIKTPTQIPTDAHRPTPTKAAKIKSEKPSPQPPKKTSKKTLTQPPKKTKKKALAQTPPKAIASSKTPTAAPSSAPTVTPTATPSSAPTVTPTAAPSSAPTVTPTAAPSLAPISYPVGVVYDYPVTTVSATCKICYDVKYDYPTITSDITDCTGPYLFVGALNGISSTSFALGAFSPASEVQQFTPVLNTPHLFNDVYWYLTPGYSFGFADNGLINQNQADFLTVGPSRLSWHLDLGVGGYRAGDVTGLNGDTTWVKRIYNCGTHVNSSF
jgi:hypothetical protein